MRTAYKGHTIETAAERHAGGGCTAYVHIYAADGTLKRASLDLGRDVTFATSELAHAGGLLLGRAWIDRLKV